MKNEKKIQAQKAREDKEEEEEEKEGDDEEIKARDGRTEGGREGGQVGGRLGNWPNHQQLKYNDSGNAVISG